MPFVHNQTFIPPNANPSKLLIPNIWTGLAYGAGRFVAVGEDPGYSTAYSTDSGQTWSAGGFLTFAAINVAYGGGYFVAVGYGNQIGFSTDGNTWANASVTNLFWQDVAYGNGLFVAVATTLAGGNTNVYATSVDGINWVMRTLPLSTAWKTVVYGNGKWIVFDNFGNARVSTDGLTWTTSVSGLYNNPTSAVYGNGYYVVLSSLGQIAYSTDAVSWTKINPAQTPDNSTSITYGNGTFSVVGFSASTGIDNIAAFATVPSTWIGTTIPTPSNDSVWSAVAYGTSPTAGFVAVGYDLNGTGPTLAINAVSQDGQTWF